MPSKVLKKSGSKRKQNGKKIIKNQTPKTKQKYEMETSPKDQMSELEKEIFYIKINEFECKLSRKKRLCSYMEEEICIYKTLYNEKQLLKSESMKLLNDAFEDFATEIFLLDQELNAMQDSYDNILKGKKFCCSYKEKVKKLSVLESRLEKELFEAEKCTEEILTLSKKFENLQIEAALKKKKFIEEDKSIMIEFEICLNRIRDELNCTIHRMIEDNSLKLNLLPLPYKALFLSGMLSSSWLDSALNCFDFLWSQNTEIERKYNSLQLSAKIETKKLKEIFSSLNIFSIAAEIIEDEGDLSSELQQVNNFDVWVNAKQEVTLMLHFQKMMLYQQDKVKSIQARLEKLESTIKALEVSGETCFQKSYLIQVVCRAGNILKQEL